MVTEIAYEVDFQSLTHFNQAFSKASWQLSDKYRSSAETAEKINKAQLVYSGLRCKRAVCGT
jgi:AraC-like DNA-binding protein